MIARSTEMSAYVTTVLRAFSLDFINNNNNNNECEYRMRVYCAKYTRICDHSPAWLTELNMAVFIT